MTTAPIHSARPMSELPPELLLRWGVPLWRCRQGVPDFFHGAENAAEAKPVKVGVQAHFAGFFVPDALSDAADALLANIQRACPWLGDRHAFAAPDALLAAESGRAWVFGEPDWWVETEALPVRCIQLPDLEAMLEEPLLKKRAYLTLLETRDDAL